VVDGNSEDETLKILNRYKDNISILISEPDSGIYDAMNKGIRLSTGEYIVFLNAGDSFYDQHTLKTVSGFCGPSLLYGKTVKRNGKNDELVSYPESLSEDYLLNYTLSHQSSYNHKNVFLKYGLYDEFYKIAGDYEFYTRLIKEEKFSSRYIEEPLSIFYLDGISNDPLFRDRLRLEQHTLRLKYFKPYKKSYKYLKYKIRCLYKTLSCKLFL
jgi:glycosyltransferase involved in cell wall biosynthesis